MTDAIATNAIANAAAAIFAANILGQHLIQFAIVVIPEALSVGNLPAI
ncbi:MAG: hypothetical protein ACREPW_08940 [Candidatus Binataceae bacterium]